MKIARDPPRVNQAQTGQFLVIASPARPGVSSDMPSAGENHDSPLTRATIVVASRDQASTLVGTEAIILGMTDGVYYGLDGVGARIWDLIQSPRSLGEVTDRLVAEFEVEADRAWEDLNALANDLISRGLVERDPAARA
jgi:hypothetical protein